VPGDIDDDMAILVVQSSPSELASIERTFPAEPIMVSEARRLAAETFRTWGMDSGQAELACLLVSEVVTNAVLHASVTPSPSRERNFGFEPLMVPAPAAARKTPVPAQAVAVPAGPAPAGAVAAGAVPAAASAWPDTRPEAGLAAEARPREFAVRLRRGATAVWVEVFDPDLRLPRIRTAGETDEGGRGLYLVEQLATRWGSRPTPEGKAVWFEMPRSGGS
jgi:anti-sigma regulatory factor (Ser/Thr protein kinase)